ncbi:hypothetical protein [Streptomyces sp. NPDC005262]|uniref:hypothetical protein n=1 Tax=Streptomyces sp. NPDC005262 TaxID=3364710 RepID=UPI0036B5E092
MKSGGRLDFTRSSTPDKKWATSPKAAPPSYRTGEGPFLAGATPNRITAVPGGEAAELTVDAQRLGGHDQTLTVTAEPRRG